MKRLSPNSDATCKACGKPAADGLADKNGPWCYNHGRKRAASQLETAAFAMLNTYGRADYAETLAGIEAYKGQPDELFSYRLPATHRRTKAICDRCLGTGQNNGSTCPHCLGNGLYLSTEDRTALLAGLPRGLPTGPTT